jgi:hypothetical protein
MLEQTVIYDFSSISPSVLITIPADSAWESPPHCIRQMSPMNASQYLPDLIISAQECLSNSVVYHRLSTYDTWGNMTLFSLQERLQFISESALPGNRIQRQSTGTKIMQQKSPFGLRTPLLRSAYTATWLACRSILQSIQP